MFRLLLYEVRELKKWMCFWIEYMVQKNRLRTWSDFVWYAESSFKYSHNELKFFVVKIVNFSL